MKKFLLVDDHSIVRAGVRLVIKNKYFNAEVDEAAEGTSAYEYIKKKEYDLVILDLHMPNTDTMGLIINAFRIQPALKILIFSMGAEDVFAKRYLKLGVKGFLSKDCEDEEIGRAIEAVLNNRKYMSDHLMERLTDDSITNKPDNPFDDLSNRELEIVMMMINGKSVSEITEILSIQNSTVGTHKARIFEKLRVSNVIDLRELARLHQLVS